MIAQDSIEALKTQLDIVDVIGNYIELKKAGANFKAPCPFHDEKSPSFVVSPSKQIYHCFGCGAGGDAIKFVMEYEHLSYPEAIEKLASNYNFSLRYTSTQKKQNSDLLQKLSAYYQSLLPHHPPAQQYLHQRGVSQNSIERFGIGYAPSSHQTLKWLEQNFFSFAEAQRLGVIGSDGNRSYARFIERITFPIHSSSGNVVGFGGRTITGHQAKYINSPETPLFNKSRLLYGYHLARESIYKFKHIIITEGYLDVVMLHQAGFTNAVATLGTALTKEHLPLLRKGDIDIIVAYDGDNAGLNAALKASKLLSAGGFRGGVVIFDGGKDPADMVQQGAIEELRVIFSKPEPFIEFTIRHIIQSYNTHDPKQKEIALQEITSYLKTLSPLLQEEYKPYVASLLGIAPHLIRLQPTNQPYQSQQPKQQERKKDLWEMMIVRTILEHPEFIPFVLDTISSEFFLTHRHEFEQALQGNTQDPYVMEILIDEHIKAIQTQEELKRELFTFLIKHYEQELKRINFDKSIDFSKKAFLIRKFRDKIMQLKKGLHQ